MTSPVVDPATAITDFASAVLLRYFRNATKAELFAPRVDRLRDLDMLRLHWSISPAVRDLTDYVIQHRHEVQGSLVERERVDSGAIRGRVDARSTAIQQSLAGHSTIYVSRDAVRSFASGINHLLAWVVHSAWTQASQFLEKLPPDATYLSEVEGAVSALNQTRRVEGIRGALADTSIGRRPSPGALSQALRSRRAVYRLAHMAYTELVAIEAGDVSVIDRLLRDTLLTPLEPWRRFELAAGLSAGEALERVTGNRLTLHLLSGDSSTPLARVGEFAIFWQTRTKFYAAPPSEPSEVVQDETLAKFGLRPDSDRPDLVVANLSTGRVISILEVKYFSSAGEDAWDRLRGAARQLVQYGRGYRELAEVQRLLGASIIALMRKPEIAPGADRPFVFDFSDMQLGGLDVWAEFIRQQPA